VKVRGCCIECEYAELVVGGEMFRCRRYAPRPAPGGVEPTEIAWPIVDPSDWCGQFLARMPDEEEGADPLSSFTRGELE